MRQSLKVITPPTFTEFTTVGAIASELGSSDDAVYTKTPALIRQASRMIVSYVGREFAFRTVEQSFYWEWENDGQYFPTYMNTDYLLSCYPVRDILSITGDDTAWDMTDVTIDAGVVEGGRWARKTVITYTCGYYMAEDPLRDLPEDLERACIDTVIALWYRPDRGDPMIKMDRADGVGITSYYDSSKNNPNALPPTAIGILDDYAVFR